MNKQQANNQTQAMQPLKPLPAWTGAILTAVSGQRKREAFVQRYM